MTYYPGKWKLVCDRCGATFLNDEMREHWTGLQLCEKCWEPRHPQDFVTGKDDDQTVPVARPDITQSVGSTTLNGAVAQYATTCTLTSSGGVAENDPIGITMDGAESPVHWTYISDLTGAVVTMGSYIPKAASSGNTVYLPSINNETWASKMTTSGSYDYNRTAIQIITEALELIGVYDIGSTLSASEVTTVLATLNMMLKAWQAEGIGLWKNVEGVLYLQDGTYSYSIGPSGDNATTEVIKTEIATAGSSTDLTITVDDDEGIADGDYIGVEVDDGTVHWTTVNGTPAANVVTLTAALDDDTAVDNHVYAFTSKIQRPLEIIEARLRNADDNDRPLLIKSRQEYMALSDKDSAGSPNLIYYDPQLTNGKMYVWLCPNDVKERIFFTSRIPIEDFDSQANDPDFPQEWLLPVAWNLAVLVAPKFGKQISPDFLATAIALKNNASGFDREQASVFFGIGE